MELFSYYANLRTEIIRVISGVKNADSSLFWDNTTRNYTTKRELEAIYEKYLRLAANYGVYVVTRHCTCENKKHGDYPTTNTYGLDMPYQSAEYLWTGKQIYQGNRLCVCPCSRKNTATNHWVIDDVVFALSANPEVCGNLASILSDVHEAIQCSGDKMPRSGIREHLLRAILRINDELLPEPKDKYISANLGKMA